jgi:hypothetical protein
MPRYLRDDDKPVIQFEPAIEISPFVLFRRLKQGQELVLIDVRATPDHRTLRGAERYQGESWEPADERPVVLFDLDGSEAIPIARRLLAAGFEGVRALFGGLELYEFSLDPEVVGEETFLERIDKET